MPSSVIPTRQVTTLTLRIPRVDWAAVVAGTKTQVRRGGRTAVVGRYKLPRPIVVYSFQRYCDTADTRMAVLEDLYAQPLGAIGPDELEAEGCEDLREFRRYWCRRHSKTRDFNPLAMVSVFCLRPWQADDRERQADVLLTHLYGPWL